MTCKNISSAAALLWLLCATAAYPQVRLHGSVTDAKTGEPLPYLTVCIKGTTNGCMSDNNGNFSFMVKALKDTLSISSIGYEEVRIPLSSKTKLPIRASLRPADYTLSEVTIKPKKERYRKKDNPAVAFVRRLIEQRDQNSPKELPQYQRDRYEKFVVALNNFDRKQKESHWGSGFEFLDAYVDTSLVSGTPILNVSARELIATDLYRKSPKSEKQYIKARRRAGIDDMFSDNEIEGILQETFKDIDIFENNVTLFRNKFVSPLSTMGPTFYKYYLMDTVMVDGERCADLTFVPYNSESFGFTGHLYVTLDSTYFVKWVQMNVPHDINLNFIQYLNVDQRFSRLPDGTRLLDYESLIAEIKIADAINGMYAKREVTYDNWIFGDTELTALHQRPEREIEEREARRRDESYWEANRLGDITEKEKSVANMMQELRNNPFYYWTEKVLTFLFTGYVPVREEAPPFFYGPVNTTVSSNALEGLRLRTGGMTSAYLNPHLMGNFYLAYGMKDERWKYMGEIEYSFKKKKEHINEFPVHSLRLRYENDIYQYGQNYLYTNKDNLFLTMKRMRDDKIGYVRKAEFTYTKEFYNGFSWAAIARNRIDEGTHLIPFVQTATDAEGTTIESLRKELKQSEFELKLRFAPGEKFRQSKWNRYPLLPERPVFTLSHRVAIKGVLGSDYTCHHTEAGFQKRFWLSAFGYTECILKAGKVWNRVPFPLLIIPNANLSYTLQQESYDLMNAMEFFNDEYASWDLTYFMNGWLFNRLPLIKRLQWREVLSCRGMMGHLSMQNRPDYRNSGDLFCFPYPSEEYHYLGDTPYVEVGFGIENIFKILRIDYVRRLTYRNYPGIDKQGIRFKIHVQF